MSRRPTDRSVIRVALLFLGFLAWALAFARCASGPPILAPTPEAPVVACIADRPFAMKQLNPGSGGRVLPEPIWLIGETALEDGARWKVIRGTYLRAQCAGDLIDNVDSCPWEPWPKDRIQVGAAACGPTAAALVDVQQREPFQ